MKKFNVTYFNYYERLYPPETLNGHIIITIPMMEGCRSLDTYYINPLLKNGFKYSESFLLGEIYLTMEV